MSKKQLEKELEKFSAPQLREIILNAYSANDVFKKYFEFFIKPDADKLLEKYKQLVHKEFNRTKWGSSKARITFLRRYVKDFSGFDPGAEYVVSLMTYILIEGLVSETFLNYSNTLRNGILGIALDMVKYGDMYQCADRVMSNIRNLLYEQQLGTQHTRNDISHLIEQYRTSVG